MRGTRLSVCVLTIIGACGIANAGLLDISFFGTNFSYTAPTGTAVLGNPGDIWNSIGAGNPNTPTDFGPISLADATNTPVAAQLSFNADGGVVCGSCSVPQPVPDLMTSYLYNNTGGSITLDLSGLMPLVDYQLVLYVASSDAGDGSRALSGSANGILFAATGIPQTSFIDGQNIVNLPAVQSNANGQILINEDNPTTDPGHEVDLNGLQLQGPLPTTATPEPSSWMMVLGGALAGLAGKLLRRK